MDTIEVLKKMCLSHSPSGREHWIYPEVEEAFKNLGEISKDNLNNIYVHKKGSGKMKVLLAAHSDEVFMMITEICDNGFLKFKSTGIDPKTLVSQEVIVHGSKRFLGIIGIKPPHLMNDKERKEAIKLDELMIDTGFDKETICKHVRIGDYVTLKRDFYELLNGNVTCKAIDDRAAITAMHVCARELKDVRHDADVYFVCSSQEEVGSRGAKVAAYTVNPDIGIAIDVTFDSGAFGDTDRENALGGGPVICIGPNVHPNVRKKIIEAAETCSIPYQVEVEPGNTGTDAWNMQIAREGIPSLLISIPIKYMHTSVEMVNMSDIENTGKLIARFIENLKFEELEGLLCF